MSTRFLLCAALPLAAAILPVRSAPGAPSPDAALPSVSVDAYDQPAITQSSSEPLLLIVFAGNPTAHERAQQNAQFTKRLARLQQSDDYKKASKDEQTAYAAFFQPEPVPVFLIGRDGAPLTDAVHFLVTDSQGRAVPLTVRPLATSVGVKGSSVLDESQTLELFFGVDASALSALPDDTYTFQVQMQVRDGQGKALPQPCTGQAVVTLKKGWIDPQLENNLLDDYHHGRFYLFDHQFARIDPYVQHMLAIDPNCISAYELQGDALAGQGKLAEAKQSYGKALACFGKKYQYRKNFEFPEYLIQRLSDVNKKLGAMDQ